MQMMQSQMGGGAMDSSKIEFPKDFTLEINGNHDTIVNLNELRKKDITMSEQIAKLFLD